MAASLSSNASPWFPTSDPLVYICLPYSFTTVSIPISFSELCRQIHLAIQCPQSPLSQPHVKQEPTYADVLSSANPNHHSVRILTPIQPIPPRSQPKKPTAATPIPTSHSNTITAPTRPANCHITKPTPAASLPTPPSLPRVEAENDESKIEEKKEEKVEEKVELKESPVPVVTQTCNSLSVVPPSTGTPLQRINEVSIKEPQPKTKKKTKQEELQEKKNKLIQKIKKKKERNDAKKLSSEMSPIISRMKLAAELNVLDESCHKDGRPILKFFETESIRRTSAYWRSFDIHSSPCDCCVLFPQLNSKNKFQIGLCLACVRNKALFHALKKYIGGQQLLERWSFDDEILYQKEYRYHDDDLDDQFNKYADQVRAILRKWKEDQLYIAELSGDNVRMQREIEMYDYEYYGKGFEEKYKEILDECDADDIDYIDEEILDENDY